MIISHREINDTPRVKWVGNIVFSFNEFDVEGFKETACRGMVKTICFRVGGVANEDTFE